MKNLQHTGSSNSLEQRSRGSAIEELQDILSTRLPSLQRRANRLLRNTADAEDAVQDALLSACAHLGQFRGQAQMSTWLNAIVNNSARMQLRRRRRYVHVSLDEPAAQRAERSFSDRLADQRHSPEQECGEAELDYYLRRFVTRLTPRLRTTFHLREIEGLSIRETAEILGVPHGTVKARAARARDKLKELMCRAVKPRSKQHTFRFRRKSL